MGQALIRVSHKIKGSIILMILLLFLIRSLFMCVRLRTAFVVFLLLTCCLVVLSCSSDDSIAPAKKNDEMPQLLSFSFKASRNLDGSIRI